LRFCGGCIQAQLPEEDKGLTWNTEI
jgi:hypothetical protein